MPGFFNAVRAFNLGWKAAQLRRSHLAHLVLGKEVAGAVAGFELFVWVECELQGVLFAALVDSDIVCLLIRPVEV
jgi:hypothetical protein